MEVDTQVDTEAEVKMEMEFGFGCGCGCRCRCRCMSVLPRPRPEIVKSCSLKAVSPKRRCRRVQVPEDRPRFYKFRARRGRDSDEMR